MLRHLYRTFDRLKTRNDSRGFKAVTMRYSSMPVSTRASGASSIEELVEVHLPDDPAIERFHSLTLEDKVFVVKLGLEMIKGGSSCLREKELTDVTRATAALREQHLLEIENLKVATGIEVETRLEVIKAANVQLQNRVSELTSQLQTSVTQLEEKHHRRSLEARDHYERKLDALQDTLERTRKDHEEYLASCAIRSANSCVKGQDGEQHVYSELNLLFPKAEIEDTHAVPGRGDFIMREDGFVMMIESKNYNRNVQKGEIDKFYRDVENPSNADIQCAVFVSLTSGISNKEDFAFEVRSGKPVLFVHKLGERYDQLVSVVKFFRLVLNHEGIDLAKKEVVDQLNHIGGTMQRNVKRQRQKADKSYQEQIALLSEQETAVLSLLATVKGQVHV